MSKISQAEQIVLSELARCVAEIAALPEQEEKREAVRALNRLEPVPPRIYCFPEAGWLDLVPPEQLLCIDPVFRGWETRLRMAILTHEFLDDDQPIDAVFNVGWHGWFDGCGLDVGVAATGNEQQQIYYLHPYSNLNLVCQSDHGAVHYEPSLKERSDIDKLRTPQLHVDHDESDRRLELAHDLFDGILQVRRRGHWWQTIGGVCQTAVLLRGMDTLMLDIIDDPKWVHEYIARLAADHHAALDQLEDGGYLSFNNGCEWIHTGGIGCSDELPQADADPARVSCRDIWGGVESQDLVGISPSMFEELFLPHLLPIVERFGLGSYGCCEPLHDWVTALRTIRNLRRISISPWADVVKAAEAIGSDYVFSRKPSPSPLSTHAVDEDAIFKELVETFEITRANDCRAEIMMKDIQTIQCEPERLKRWVRLAKTARERIYD